MSLLTKEHRLSVKPFAAVPALLELPEIKRGPASVSNVSSRLSSMRGSIYLEEGCLITKSVKYTHRLAHMVNAVYSGDPQPVQDLLEFDLRVIPYARFDLEHPCNLTFLEPFIHTSLDLYAFIALSPSSSTVNGLIEMVKSDNDRRQQEMDWKGGAGRRSLNFLVSSFTNPEYELVSLHPEHFLPRGSALHIYDPATRTWKNYVPSRDRRLRESIEPDSARLPPFHHDFQSRRVKHHNVNIFLVALNAEIKFRRYLKMIQEHPPTTALPDDVLALMRSVIELVNLLYWVPLPTKGSKGYPILVAREFYKPKNPERAGRPSQLQYIETTSDEEGGVGLPTPSEAWKMSKCSRRPDWLADADVETRKAYGSALMSGHDIDYDPALFEDAFPINDRAHLYSDKAAMETWKQGVTEGLSA